MGAGAELGGWGVVHGVPGLGSGTGPGPGVGALLYGLLAADCTEMGCGLVMDMGCGLVCALLTAPPVCCCCGLGWGCGEVMLCWLWGL